MAIEINSEIVTETPVPAATVMVVRDTVQGPQVLMVRRHGDSGVLGGVHVFPGGKMDAQDGEAPAGLLDRSAGALHQALCEPALTPGLALGLHVAALRETFEECGLWLGTDLSARALQRARDALAAGAGFVALAQALDLQLHTAGLVPWSRWITPRQPSVSNRRFDTRFFLARAPEGQTPQHDDHEATEAVWLAPREGLQQYWCNQIELAPPQIVCLAELARLGCVADMLACAHGRTPPLVAPEAFDLHGERVICYPGDPRHSVPQRAWAGPTRLSFRNGRFEPDGGLAALLAP
jgi:8-oxo-dGTP pyrophosphatase MutT (NUDIX family)